MVCPCWHSSRCCGSTGAWLRRCSWRCRWQSASLLASTRIQQKLSSHQIAAKIEAGNRLEEYLQGIRVMKAYNMVGDGSSGLREAFAQLRRACIRQEALLGPFVLLSITVVRAGA